ncbi:MAG: hypothetical protein IPN92_12545 [Chromatiaceae bacterium]|nr:hypothetical protein [Chromatiaceae bacterium]
MTTSYEIHFSGDLLPGVDPAVARARIQGLFKLTDAVAARLFSGQTVALKRGLDLARAERLRQVFLEVGALARLVEQGPAVAPAPHATPVPEVKAALPRDWTLAPADGRPLEPDPGQAPPTVDISGMSLISGQEWSLAECDQGATPVVAPDISHLRILAPEPDPGEGAGAR